MRALPIFLIVSLLGCGRSRETTLTIWSGPSGVEEKAFLKLCQRFEVEHPGVRVHNLGKLLEDKLIRAIVAGAPPDLAYLYGTSDVGPLAANGAIIQLDDRFQRSGLRDEQFLPFAIAQGRYKGPLYAMPVTRDCHALYWNRRVFRENGLNPDSPPRTIEELVELAKRLTRKRPDGSLERLGFRAIPDDDNAMMLVVMGGRLFDDQTGRLLLTSPETVRALERLVKLVDDEGGREALMSLKAAVGRTDTAQNPIATGRVAMSIEGEWVAMHMEKYSPGADYGIGQVPYPADRPELRNLAWQDGDVMIVPSGAAHPDLAWEFILFMQQPRQQEEYAAAMNNLPSVRSLMGSPLLSTGSRAREALGYILKNVAGSSQNAQGFPTMPVSRFFRDVLDHAIEVAELHQATAQQALASAQSRIEDELRKYDVPR